MSNADRMEELESRIEADHEDDAVVELAGAAEVEQDMEVDPFADYPNPLALDAAEGMSVDTSPDGPTLTPEPEEDDLTPVLTEGGTCQNPKILLGSGPTPDETPAGAPGDKGYDASIAWDVDRQESGWDGVQFFQYRTFFSGTVGDNVLGFKRAVIFDSAGRLAKVGIELQETLFETGPCHG
jgi:hypothetical protein